MKKLLVLPLLATTLLIGQLAHAVNFAQFVKERSAALAIGLGKHSYCESSVNSPEITGHNADKLVPIASVSKVFTTYFAVAKLGAFHRFETTIYVTEFNPATGAAAIHIQGSDDPYFTYDKVFFMIAELNKQGIKTLTKVTFDEGLRTFTKVREGSSPADDIDAYKFDPVTLADTQRSLTLLLNTNTWSQYSAKRAKGSVIVNGNELYKETLAAAAAKGTTCGAAGSTTT
ncbi:MAG: D-alanyl-D-alanine carboxypeptidase, partial [Bdellovibrionota bacterium]